MADSEKLGLVLGGLRKMWDVLGDHWMPLLVLWDGSVPTGVWGAQGQPRRRHRTTCLCCYPFHRQKNEVPVSERTRNALHKGLEDPGVFQGLVPSKVLPASR